MGQGGAGTQVVSHGLVGLKSQRMAIGCLAFTSLARIRLTIVNGGEAIAGHF